MKTRKLLLAALLCLAFGNTTTCQAQDAAQSAEAWQLYPSYAQVTETQDAGNRVFVLASGNLYSYTPADNAIALHNKTTGLHDHLISHIAWCEDAQRLVIVYQNSNIDLLSPEGDAEAVPDLFLKPLIDVKTVNDVSVSGSVAWISTGSGVLRLDVRAAAITDYYRLGTDVKYTYADNGWLYAATPAKGILRCPLSANLYDHANWVPTTGYVPKAQTPMQPAVKPDGPLTNDAYRVILDQERIYIAPGLKNIDKERANAGNVYYYDGSAWGLFQNDIASLTGMRYLDVNCLAIDPKDRDHVWVGGKNGLFEFRNTKFVKDYRYGYEGVPFETSVPTSSNPKNWGIISDLAYDANGNLWVMNCLNPRMVYITPEGEFRSFDQSKTIKGDNANYPTTPLFDNRGELWFCTTQWKLSRVFHYDIAADKLYRIDEFVNHNGTRYLPYLHCLGSDHRNNVWVGADNGLYCLTNADIQRGNYVFTQFRDRSDSSAGGKGFILNGVPVNVIVTDSYNQKWVGTEDNGVFVISDDCTTVVKNLTTSNSPLISNSVTGLAIHPQTGRVFIATDKGLCSYMPEPVEYTVPYGDGDPAVSASPSVAQPSFRGDVRITGLPQNEDVVILTAAGERMDGGKAAGGEFRFNVDDETPGGVYLVATAGNRLLTKFTILK